MRLSILIIINLICSISLLAQVKELKRADNYFYSFNYNKAIEAYLELEKSGEALYYVSHRIGDCYGNIGESEKAIEWYLKAIEYPDISSSVYLNLIKELKKLKRYDEADKYLNVYNSTINKEDKVNSKSITEGINDLYSDSLNYIIHNLSINSPESDISPVIHKNKLVFASNKYRISAINRSDVRDGSNFYKLYSSKYTGLVSVGEPTEFDDNLKSKFNDGPISFNKDYTISFTTRNISSKGKNKNYLGVFVNYYKNGKWKRNSTPIPLHQNKFSIMHAFLTKDNVRLFFVSDMEGGYGGYDIYYSDYKDGFLSPPVNLGPKINTPENEMFPFVANDGTLYYASDEIRSMGGMDLFMAFPEGTGYSQSFNLGYPMNTSYDDFGIYYLDDGLSGYFVSNRPGGKGDDDIYAFQEKKKIKFERISGVINSVQDMNPLKDVIISLYDGNNEIAQYITDETGEFVFYYKPQKDLQIIIKKRFYETYKNKLSDEITRQDGRQMTFFMKLY